MNGDMKDLFYVFFILFLFGVCYHRITLLSHRVEMVIIVQQSQEQSLKRLDKECNQ